MFLAIGHHAQESSARVVILSVLFQMFGKVLNPLGQYRNLHLGRARVFLMTGRIQDQLMLFYLRNHP